MNQAIAISNDLYGNDVMSAHELAKGYPWPIQSSQSPMLLPQQVYEAYQNLLAKRKLTLILRSKTFEELPISVGDTVPVYLKHQNRKRGIWSPPKPVLSFDIASRTGNVPGTSGKKVRVAIEDVRPATCTDELASAVQDAIDETDRTLEDKLTKTVQDAQTGLDDHASHSQTPIPAMPTEDNPPIGQQFPSVGDQIKLYWPRQEVLPRHSYSAQPAH